MERQDVDSMSSHSMGQLTGRTELRDIVEAFPPGIVHSFGYGSGVFAQQLDEDDETTEPNTETAVKELPMLDLILVVEDSKAWHEANLFRHPHHYSPLCRCLGGGFCANLQRNYGAGVFFHALVPAPPHNDGSGRLLKYGVVQTEDLARDLKNWDWLYLAGRLHKPTVAITNHNEELDKLQHECNLPYALAASLLLFEDVASSHSSVELEQVYEKIANLSYAGDIRMDVGGEDPEKVHKLVHSPGQLKRFHSLYREPLQKLETEGLISVVENGTKLEWDSTAVSTRQALWSRLPPRLQQTPSSKHSSISSTQLAQSLAAIVAPAARYQSLKGILTSGIVKSLRYAGAKFAKGFIL